MDIEAEERVDGDGERETNGLAHARARARTLARTHMRAREYEHGNKGKWTRTHVIWDTRMGTFGTDSSIYVRGKATA
eukprot:2573031-Pleurochrysis_carterae.AAC.1